MEYEKSVSQEMAEDALRYIYDKYPDLSCGEYMEFSSRLQVDVAHWLAKSLNKKPKEVLDAMLSVAIQIDIIENGEEMNDS